MDLRLGIDVGGTNTDAVVVDPADRLLAKSKVPTSADVTGGITAALDAVLAAPGVRPQRVTHVMLGTTHATNAVLERRALRKVAVLRVGAPASSALRPLSSWPADLRAAASAGEAVVGGGIEFDGREIVPFDRDAAARFLASVAGRAEGVAITSVFAPVSPEHELAAARVARAELGGAVDVSMSHEIGSVGLLEREHATVLNAALMTVAGQVAQALQAALRTHGLAPLTFFAQNDGTLMALDYALRYPVLTIRSGPANSMRGAAHLAAPRLRGAADALVADVGGTSTDVGALARGFPRESHGGMRIGGIRTNFRTPDLVALTLGGGTVVTPGEPPQLGPRSVGYRLTEEALVFGGGTATLTDAAVAAGRARIGSRRPPRKHLALLAAALTQADAALATAVDQVKLSRAPLPLIVVGGGSVLVPEELPGVSEVVRPDHYEVANAVGATIASVSGQVDRVFGREEGRAKAIDRARAMAFERAVQAGADPTAVEVVEVEEIPLSYLRRPAIRVRVKAAGPLGAV